MRAASGSSSERHGRAAARRLAGVEQPLHGSQVWNTSFSQPGASWSPSAAGLVGLVLGNLRLPAVLLLASSPAAGAGANIGISAVAAATASIAHIRAGRVNWRLFAWMAPPSIVGALVGGYLSGVVPGDVLLLSIAAVLLYSAVELFGWEPPARGPDREGHAVNLTAAVVAGFVVGLLGGFVGLILGSLRMPALLRFVGEAPACAVGTNVTIGFCVGVAGVIGHLPSAPPTGTCWRSARQPRSRARCSARA